MYAVCTACFTLHYNRVTTSKALLLLFSVIKSAFRNVVASVKVHATISVYMGCLTQHYDMNLTDETTV